uniref:Golgi reassembly-stacking protein 2-like n=1 Tax=Myxine glutinosa TaxID=7769 RepID=UPI00358F7305
MGGLHSSENPGLGTEGYHVLKVHENSPGHKAGLEVCFDFILSIGETRLNGDKYKLQEVLLEHVEKPVPMVVYNTKTQDVREVTITPSTLWDGPGLLGVNICYSSFDKADEKVWHILDVEDNSPASLAGLQPFTDYIMGIEESEDLFPVVEAHVGKQLQLYMYNSSTDSCREVMITPSRTWGGEGSLGCKVGYGYLHRIPRTAVQHPKRQNLSDNATSSQGLAPQALADKPVTVPAPPTSSVVDLPTAIAAPTTTFHEEVLCSGMGLHPGAIIPNLTNDAASIDLPINPIVHLAADAPAILQFCDPKPSLQPPQSNVLHYPCLAPDSSALPELQSVHDHPTAKISATPEGCTTPIPIMVGAEMQIKGETIVPSSNNSDLPGIETNIDNQEVATPFYEQGRCEKTEEKVNELLEEETNTQKIVKSFEEDTSENCVFSSEVMSKVGEREEGGDILAVESLREEELENNCTVKDAQKAQEEEQQYQMEDALAVDEGEKLFVGFTTKCQEKEEIQLQVQEVIEGQNFDGNTDELENQEPEKHLSREKYGNNFVAEETKFSKEQGSGKLEVTDNRSEEDDLDKAADDQEAERTLEKPEVEQHFEEEKEENLILKDQQSYALDEETLDDDEEVTPRAEDEARKMFEDLQMKGNSVEQEVANKEF